jgi:hypothetical protein
VGKIENELHNLCFSPNIIRMIRSKKMRQTACMSGKSYTSLEGKSEWKKPPGLPRSRCEDINKMDRKEIGWKDVVWIHLDQDSDQLKDLSNRQ